MKVNIAEELSKRCMCPRCEVEREAWQEYVDAPWTFMPLLKAKRDEEMYAISPGWCSQCEVFSDCVCGAPAALRDEPLSCGSYNPCEEHLDVWERWSMGIKLCTEWDEMRRTREELEKG
jgi:hypothetical protein